MTNLFPLLFVFFWSSAFVSGQIIVQSASPFASLSFRFIIVALGFLLFSYILREKIFVKSPIYLFVKFGLFQIASLFHSDLRRFENNYVVLHQIDKLFWSKIHRHFQTLTLVFRAQPLLIGSWPVTCRVFTVKK